jgi:hypothetical protein
VKGGHLRIDKQHIKTKKIGTDVEADLTAHSSQKMKKYGTDVVRTGLRVE